MEKTVDINSGETRVYVKREIDWSNVNERTHYKRMMNNNHPPFYCEACKFEMKYNSKKNHIKTRTHKLNQEILEFKLK